tara:strand:- start:122 stop:1096 length:975 start_codon:yes stop_codon:yes gene_type:complete
MSYIGSKPATSFVGLSSQSFTGGSGTSFTLNKSVSSTSDIAVFVNNVRQSPVNSSYSVSGTTLTMSASIASSDIFYVVFLGATTGTVNPQAGSVGSSQITSEMISGQTALGVAPADTDEFLVSDAGVLKRIDYSLIKSQGGLVHLSGTTHTSTATLDFTTSGVIDLSKYRKYMLRIAGVKADTGSAGSLNMQVFHSGSIQTGSVYKYVYLRHRLSSSSTSGGGSTGSTSIIINPSNYSGSATGMEHNGEVFVDFTPYYFTMNSLTSAYHNTSLNALSTNMSAGIYSGNSSQNVTGFRILMSSNNIKGRIDLYGITNSLGDNGDW